MDSDDFGYFCPHCDSPVVFLLFGHIGEKKGVVKCRNFRCNASKIYTGDELVEHIISVFKEARSLNLRRLWSSLPLPIFDSVYDRYHCCNPDHYLYR